ncbi:probable RNA-binding protein 19 isoform X3 [Alligator sinensis]|uniref:Probable RNA-binding protein 19 n=1 Tax=Alligator sinensis TaxID=38654 RepID=A0A3Q0FNF8_ALLSI|nr:probable RNA-binding protein 19 isoform X3 [Alligator sinensis]
MSRLIVKNLPNGMKEDRFRKLFAAFGTLTDCCLKFTKDGKFRKFGFVGFKSEDEAKTALNHFHRSFIDTSRITVEVCKSFGDPSKPKPWSKHSQKPANKPAANPDHTNTKKDKKVKNVTGNLKELEGNEEFREFLMVHQKRSQVATWANDTLAEEPKARKLKPVTDYLNFDSSESSDLSEESGDEFQEEEDKGNKTKGHPTEKVAVTKGLSDMDYLKSKVVKDTSLDEESEEEEEDSEQHEESSEEEEKPSNMEGIDVQMKKGAMLEEEIKEQGKSKEEEKKKGTKSELKNWADSTEATMLYTVKLRGAPFNVTEQNVREFLLPLKPVAIRIARNKHGNKTGYVFVDFTNEEEVQKALKQNNEYMGGRYIEVSREEQVPKMKFAQKEQQPWQRRKKDDEEEEDLSESGRLFVRNLPYSATEEDLEKLFSKYGQNAACVTIYPKERSREHKCCRILFIQEAERLQGESKQWQEGRGSVAVRVALGETQLVQEVRQFLIDNGVSLDSFSQASGERSKTVILAKNLPAGTCVTELEEVFGRHGSLGRVLLPEGGITAIVEFLEPTEAKRAFTKLAYSKFQHVPLYLEWAPMDVFSCPPPEKKQPETPEEAERARLGAGAEGMKEDLEELAVEEEDEEEESVPGCTLFIKNLSFATTEETLREAFSKVGAVKSCTISKKTDKAGTLLSMGFGFVEYKKPENAQKALRQLQGCMVDGHQLEVKISERAIKSTVTSSRKKQILKKQKSSKILVRNIPFQATVREVRELFSTFGELKTVRLPKKMAGTGSHRGFGFVDFLTKQDAKKAFNALCHSTHLYGRRLVLEWADTEETVEALRRKTAEHFHGSSKKKKQSVILDEILQQIEEEYDDDGDH